jgi:flagellar FliJ protein
VYRFNLQVVLNYRKRLEEGLQMELSRTQRELESAKQVFFAYQQEKVYYEEELSKRESREVNIGESILYRDYLKGMNRKIKAQREIVAKAKIGVDKKQEELLVATKKRKVLEKVKEKHMKEFMDDLERKERIFTDEISIQRYQKGGTSTLDSY